MNDSNPSLSDVTAVVLSIGEPYVERAIDSVRRQSLPAREIVVVENVSPGHQALNHGIRQVRTAFFVEVDADMILDPSCFAELRAGADASTGVVIGPLYDPLMGPIAGVKLFRTECFGAVEFPDTLSPDTDLVKELEQRGYEKRIRLCHPSPGQEKPLWHVFGLHEPDYTPLYTFEKYAVLGRRYRYRNDPRTYRWRLDQLRRLPSETTLIARAAMAHGLFLPGERDLLQPKKETPAFRFLMELLGQTSERGSCYPAVETLDFAGAFALGGRMRSERDGRAFRDAMDRIGEIPAVHSWEATTGLCHGLLADDGTPVPEGPWPNSGS